MSVATTSSDTAPSGLASATSLNLPRWLWQPNAIVFVSSFCSMVLELVAGRIIAPYVGVSLYTWTSVIGVVLAGISLGNYLGGRLADRWANPAPAGGTPATHSRAGLRLLGLIFLLGGLTSLQVLAVDTFGHRMPGSWPIVIQILALTAALFFIPCAILGCISPIVAKLAVRDLARTGSTVGKIYAFSTVGSIVGTFATGFWLISAFGTYSIVWGVAVVLSLMGLLFLSGGRPLPVSAGIAAVAIASVLVVRQGWLRGFCTLETNYFCIKVHDDERNGKPVRVLVLDRLVHSYTSLDDPTQLVYGYEQIYAELAGYRVRTLPQGQPLRSLFIGGGGYTFPKYIEAVYPGSQIEVVEIDPGVTQTAYNLLGLSRQTTIQTANEDARLYMDHTPGQPFDLVMGDAFNDFSVPYHLTTRDFNEQVHAWLAPGGLYMVNLIDGPSRQFLRAYVNTLRQTFSYVYVAPAVDSWRQSPRVTFVVVGADRPLDLGDIRAAAPGGDSIFVRDLLDPATLQAVLAEGPQVMLTDQYAPIDQMLAPVVRGEPAQ